jgi:PIN domain nuclease of toxin-antitoxin system
MSGLLLDTQALLWLLGDSPRMGAAARARIATATSVRYSAASVWEIEIKRASGKLRIERDLAAALGASGLAELPVTAAHALAIGAVELPHRDPFDRLLLTQAGVEGLTFLTADAVLLSLTRSDLLDAGS